MRSSQMNGTAWALVLMVAPVQLEIQGKMAISSANSFLHTTHAHAHTHGAVVMSLVRVLL